MHSQHLKDSWSKCWMVCRGKPLWSAQMTQSSVLSPWVTNWSCAAIKKRLQAAELKLNGRTYLLFQRRVTFLGHVVMPSSERHLHWHSEDVSRVWLFNTYDTEASANAPWTLFILLKDSLTSPSRYTKWLGQQSLHVNWGMQCCSTSISWGGP